MTYKYVAATVCGAENTLKYLFAKILDWFVSMPIE